MDDRSLFFNLYLLREINWDRMVSPIYFSDKNNATLERFV